MSPEHWGLFVLASLPVHLAPGPNNLLALSNAARFGYPAGHLGSLGRYPAYALIFLAAALGLGAVLMASSLLFLVLKLAGGAYLLWTGWKLFAARQALPAMPGEPAGGCVPWQALWRREFLVAAANPKAVLFATAFYAQFIDPAAPGYPLQFSEMVLVSLALESCGAGVYALAGAGVGAATARGRFLAWINRLSGAALMAMGVVLFLARRPTAA